MSHAQPFSVLKKEDQININNVLSFWFGHVEETIVPSVERARLWFDHQPAIDDKLKERFAGLVEMAMSDKLEHWLVCAKGQLACILLLDQFPRHIFRGLAKAYRYDRKALAICVKGASKEDEHDLSLIERVFYYFPLLHSEELVMQQQAIHAYHLLTQYALDETKTIYQSFLEFAHKHYQIIELFGRFPRRNAVLGRVSTAEELDFLDQQSENTS